ncbi:MAG: 3-isopropylmalate dehydratase small subunit [Roseibium sp.]
MAGWTEHTGYAVALPLQNVDTDQLIPARFMSNPRKEGYGRFLLHDLRRDTEGIEHPDFPLNRHRNASVLVTGQNFGCGSSREAAVYALVDAGIQAVIAPSFGDIFAGNAVNNGLLPAQVSENTAKELIDALGSTPCQIHLQLETGRIDLGELNFAFDLEPSWRTKLINGWDDIDLTLQHLPDIARHKEHQIRDHSWAWPKAGQGQ